MNYPYPPPYPTIRVCPQCHQHLRLVDFRRWDTTGPTAKRRLHDECNFCAQRAAPTPAPAVLVARGEISPIVAAHREARAAARAHARASEAAARRAARKRKQAWTAAIFSPLGKELAWAMHARITARDNSVEDRRYQPWLEFFDAYCTVLQDMQRRARTTLALRYRSGQIEPPPEAVRLERYLMPQTLGSLRRLYGACTPIPGIRSFREPNLMLRWRTADVQE